MTDTSPTKRKSDEPRRQLIQLYLEKGNKKNAAQVRYLKEKGVKYFLTEFGSNIDKGLTSDMVQKNTGRFGTNTYKKKKTKSFIQILIDALSDKILIILMVAAVIQIIVEYFFSDERQTFWLQGVSILAAVAVVSLVSTFNDYQKQKQFEQLNAIEQSSNKFKALRDGQIAQIHKNSVVVGDILLIDAGSQIPADGIVVSAQQAVVDQGAITGQAIQKFKNPIQFCSVDGDDQSQSPVVISGTNLTSGFLKMLVLVVGKESAAGELNQKIMSDDNQQQTPLQIKLDHLVGKIGKLGIATAAIVFLTLTIRLIVSDLVPHGWSKSFITQILKYLILAISIIVVSIPEGLPLAVTLSLAYSVKQMLKQKNLVRKLASCETMGGAHVICTDKTGTLTQNQMFVTEVWNGKLNDIPTFKNYVNNNKNKGHILNSLLLNTKASLEPKPSGSSTEQALLKFCREATPVQYKQFLKNREKKVLAVIPFNSDRKRMSTLIQQNGKKVLLHKGGVQIVVQACDKMEIDGQVRPIDKKQIQRNVQQMAKKGLRVIALAYKEVQDVSQIMSSTAQAKKGQTQQSHHHGDKPKSGGVLNIEKSGFTLHMLTGIQDLPRKETKSAIASCHRGGVLVIMVTGDNKLTARAIADQVGITSPNDTSQNMVRQGKQIEQISPEDPQQKIAAFLKNLKVMARSRPQHKHRLVSCIKKLNNVVAVTGDGTNDAPALMKADVGFAMGITGTQIAKSASDIIIMDDNFHSIVRALIWGRNIYQSIRKFLQFQLTVNIVACVLCVLSAVVIRQSLFTAIQMLWVNMIMDSLASLALATQPPNGQQLLDRKPFEKNQPLITKTMLKHIIGQAAFQIFVLLLLLFLGPTFIPQYADEYDSIIGSDLNAKYYMGQPEGTVTSGMFYTLSGQDNYITHYNKYKVHSRHFTFIFTAFVMMQIFNFFNCRRIRDQPNILANPCSNWLYWLIVAFIFIFQFLITYFLSVFFKMYKFRGLTFQQWVFAIFFGSLTLLVSQILRLLPFWKPLDGAAETGTVYDEDLKIKYRKDTTKEVLEEKQNIIDLNDTL